MTRLNNTFKEARARATAAQTAIDVQQQQYDANTAKLLATVKAMASDASTSQAKSGELTAKIEELQVAAGTHRATVDQLKEKLLQCEGDSYRVEATMTQLLNEAHNATAAAEQAATDASAAASAAQASAVEAAARADELRAENEMLQSYGASALRTIDGQTAEHTKLALGNCRKANRRCLIN